MSHLQQCGLPKAQGLYDPAMEHDACGVGFIVDINGNKSYEILEDALSLLKKLDHRGAKGADEDTGDGAGIMLQIPHEYFYRECKVLGFELPEEGEYAVGMLYTHRYDSIHEIQMRILSDIIEENGLKVLGLRQVPIDTTHVGEAAKRVMPRFVQIFIGKNGQQLDEMAFERKLYVIRKQAENKITPLSRENGGIFYFQSLSSRTIVYKGMLTASQLSGFYLDLSDMDFKTKLAMVHSRFSTNTFPSWERAHPNRYTVHNGEINTIRGNVNWMRARQKSLRNELPKEMSEGNVEDIFPIIDEQGSDSSMFDNCLEFMHLTGRSLPETMMLLIPEPWEKNDLMPEDVKNFYAFGETMMEPWDGPAVIGFTDSHVIGAMLDRNGLRPARYYQTKNNRIILASEVGVVAVKEEDILYKGRLEPGKMLLIDMDKGRVISDEEIKKQVAHAHPYDKWRREQVKSLEEITAAKKLPKEELSSLELVHQMKAFGYTYEDVEKTILPMSATGKEAIGSMGADTPLAVLSEKPQPLYLYFKQLFAQVTNPPIDGLREDIVMSSAMILGEAGNLLKPEKKNSLSILLSSPILSTEEFEKLLYPSEKRIKTKVLSLLYKAGSGVNGMKRALRRIYMEAEEAIAQGVTILILSDRGIDKDHMAIPALLATSGLHHHLVGIENRTGVGLVVDSGEPREVHHFSTLVGYGATAIHPYMAYNAIELLHKEGRLDNITLETAVNNFIHASVDGMLKIITKMGITKMNSYHGAQIFEAIGISSSVINQYFTGTPTRLEGVGLEEIEKENQMRHDTAYSTSYNNRDTLETGGYFQVTADGEEHLYNAETIYLLQKACREGDYQLYKQFAAQINESQITLRSLFEIGNNRQPIPIEEVESVESIVKRFKTGAMSYGSISKEAHECLAIAMNRLGGKSNTGEGGESEARFQPLPNGDTKISAVKQVASGRFGVTSHYLVNSREIQIKMAQGAKPGEGGHLPGGKVFPEVARLRHSTPGVSLLSPPTHHDIYSIEDLKELIYDLKNANRNAEINVKLVSEAGIGTIAAGVAKAKADVILISGYDGGTGAAPKTSIQNAGLPWELGLAETHQTLVLNRLREKVKLEVDGKLLTGKDVAIAALLGAEEFGFATGPLVALGCVMMRVCSLNTCPVGIATQDERLRKCFTGKPEYVENFMKFIAADLREWMAKLGFTNVDEMIGRTDCLHENVSMKNWKSKSLNLSSILFQPYAESGTGTRKMVEQNHELEDSLDQKKLLAIARPALQYGYPVRSKLRIENIHRSVGTMVGSEVSRVYGKEGLPEDTIQFTFVGTAGQSLGAFLPRGITIKLIGDANDYLGKGLSGGKIAVITPKEAKYQAEENMIAGNVILYGATSGEVYLNGLAGERFCVRNSGATAVTEGCGNHGCEYMTGGTVLILGPIGQNFAAGMSGGKAYILNMNQSLCNRDMVHVRKTSDEDLEEIYHLLKKHVIYTDSRKGKHILENWTEYKNQFSLVIPKEYQVMQEKIKEAKEKGFSGDEALQEAFHSLFSL
ncbi:glutamate synthase large subunit [Lachnospiraceae bacterium MD1]|uniref:Glutamate synthase large subunit n=1 Tax=Variimorphobacter saccharofermentans TaxID=2755051 RepID=A0A839K2G9_9FIRM|nr:glutamate synthase large subunit [Variimorphobacter saccharofermentans]MBB2183392.1 glutamate synthase large subunit [Variimorphobacter saccharofermentans]